jgi:hypothetical protein
MLRGPLGEVNRAVYEKLREQSMSSEDSTLGEVKRALWEKLREQSMRS